MYNITFGILKSAKKLSTVGIIAFMLKITTFHLKNSYNITRILKHI